MKRDVFSASMRNIICTIKYLFNQEDSMARFGVIVTHCDVDELEDYDEDL